MTITKINIHAPTIRVLLNIFKNSLFVTFFERKYIVKADTTSNSPTTAIGNFCKSEEIIYYALLSDIKIYLYQQSQFPADC